MNKKSKIVFGLIGSVFLSGCASSLEESRVVVSPYKKNAHLICAGDYYVNSEGEISNSFLRAADSTIQSGLKYNDWHELAKSNFAYHIMCLNLSESYFREHEIKTLSDEDIDTYRKIILNTNGKKAETKEKDDKTISWPASTGWDFAPQTT